MERRTITLGATTSAGGKVTTASSHGSINGATIALEDDQIVCPACKSKGKILCVGPRLPETWNGKQVALENDLCLCGCFPSPRLISNQSLRCQVTGDNAGGTSSEKHPSPLQTPAVPTTKPDELFDLDFLVLDEHSGLPLHDWPYSIELSNGEHFTGFTDQSGKTIKVAATFAADAIVRLYSAEPAAINPLWDR